MRTVFHLKRKRIATGILFFIIACFISTLFLFHPEIFLRNKWMKIYHIQTLGVLGIIYSLIMLWSFSALIFRKKAAFIIADSYLIDHSKFESFGKIQYHDIQHVERIKKHSLAITLREPLTYWKRLNLLQKAAFLANNWTFNKRIVVSAALIECDISVLEKAIVDAIKRQEKGIDER
jgi:hypothetical protein